MLGGERELVTDELAKMHRFLLGPLGATTAPPNLDEAVASYRKVRAHASKALGADVDPELGRQVSEALGRHGLVISR